MKGKELQLFVDFEKDNKWFQINYGRIQDTYKKEFVAIKEEQIIAHAPNMENLIKELKEKRIDPAFALVKFIYEKGVIVIL